MSEGFQAEQGKPELVAQFLEFIEKNSGSNHQMLDFMLFQRIAGRWELK